MMFPQILFFFFNLFIYFWLCWVFVSVRGLSPAAASGGHSSSRCAGLSLSQPLVAEHRLQTRRLSNCGSRAQLLRGMWDLPRPGLEPVSPALAGRFSTTAPPGKPTRRAFYKQGPEGREGVLTWLIQVWRKQLGEIHWEKQARIMEWVKNWSINSIRC